MLPYLNYQNRLKLNHAVPHCLVMCNGFRVVAGPQKQPDGSTVEQVAHNDTALYDPMLTYGIVSKPHVPPFRPKFVLNDKIVLTFNGFFRQHIVEPNHRSYDRIRYVNVMYFMEDDTITVMEPPVVNSGVAHGRIVRRSRILKNVEKNEYYSWKDLNIGIDLNLFGIKYHLLDCDPFTREFLKANGIEINELETRPEPVERPKTAAARIPTSMRLGTLDSSMPKSMKTDCDGIILTFHCIRIEEKKRLSQCISYHLRYFVEDDTITIIEAKGNQEGRGNYPLLLKRMKVPKNSKQFLASSQIFPMVASEPTDKIVGFIGPKELKIGHEVCINGHRFLLLDCDAHTRKYYMDVLKMPQDDKVNVEATKVVRRKAEMPVYLGFGTPEDSLQSCLRLVPRPPRKNIKQYLLNANKHLAFSCILDTAHPEDATRTFILKYGLADGTIGIIERLQANSGIQSAKFLSAHLIRRPGSDPNCPEYYTAKDLFIGAVLTINSFRFKIVNAGAAVYRYMQEHPEMFSAEAIDGVRENVLAASGQANFLEADNPDDDDEHAMGTST